MSTLNEKEQIGLTFWGDDVNAQIGGWGHLDGSSYQMLQLVLKSDPPHALPHDLQLP